MSSQAKSAASTDSGAEVSVTSDGLVRKTIVKEGEGDPAGRGAKVTIKYTLRRAGSPAGNGDVIDSSDRRPNGTLTFTQGRKKVLPALDVIVPTMRRGEISKATVGPSYAFGVRGLPRKKVPPNCSILLEVEMIEFSGGEVKKPIKEMTPRERFEEAKVCKEAGNVFFKEVKYEKAMMQYTHCIRYAANVFYKRDDSDDRKENSDDASSKQAATEGSGNLSEKTEKDEGFTEATVTEEEEVVETLDVSTATRGEPAEEADDRKPTQATDANGVEPDDKTQSEDKTGNEVNVANEHDVNSAGSVEQKDEDDGKDDPTEDEARALHVTALNNLSLCLVKMEEFKQAVEAATMALQLDPQSSKAFYHRYVMTFCALSQNRFPVTAHIHPDISYLTLLLSYTTLLSLPIEGVRKFQLENGIKQWKISKQRKGCSLKIWGFVWRLQSWRKSVRTSRISRRSRRQQCLRNWVQNFYADKKDRAYKDVKVYEILSALQFLLVLC